MSQTKTGRWYPDKKTGLPTIRKHPDAREYQTPKEVERVIKEPDSDYYSNYPIQGTCGHCGEPYEMCDD